MSDTSLLHVYECDPDCQRPDVRLAALISDASEECWCAGWYMGCEHSLWMMVTGVYPSHATTQDGAFDGYEWGMGRVTPEELAEMTRLSGELGAWVRWVKREPYGGVELVPMAEWLDLHDAWKAARAAESARLGHPWDKGGDE